MHFEILVEDRSGEIMINSIIPRIIDLNSNSYRIHSFEGCGSLPKELNVKNANDQKALLPKLPNLLDGYGRTYKNCVNAAAVIVVCDLDNRNQATFLQQLNAIRDGVLGVYSSSLKVFFCLAIEEGEAWLLGDLNAIKKAYPKAKMSDLSKYKNDSICDTWEKLADAIYPGGG